MKLFDTELQITKHIPHVFEEIVDKSSAENKNKQIGVKKTPAEQILIRVFLTMKCSPSTGSEIHRMHTYLNCLPSVISAKLNAMAVQAW